MLIYGPPCSRQWIRFTRFCLLLLLLTSFFRQLLSELTERNSAKTGHMLGSECDLKMHVQNLGYQLTATLTA